MWTQQAIDAGVEAARSVVKGDGADLILVVGEILGDLVALLLLLRLAQILVARELEPGSWIDEVKIADEAHYRLVPAEQISAEELAGYRLRKR